MTGSLSVHAPDGVPEIEPGTDLGAVLLAHLAPRDGDVVAVTSKVVAKAEGRLVAGDRAAAVAGETTRVVARRGETVVVRTRHGLTLAAAGVDTSNVPPGWLALLPLDPDRSARSLRAAVRARTGANVGVLVTDTAGRAWRHGQTDLAIGAAGLVLLDSYAGRVDAFGNRLTVTAPAVADELASAAELAQGKLAGRPFALLRGRADLVLPPDEHGPGARALVREEAEDLFGYGAREAVIRALEGAESDRAVFGAPATADEVEHALRRVLGPGTVTPVEAPGPTGRTALRVAGDPSVVRAVVFAHGWLAETDSSGFVRIAPPGP
ncbi:MAG TPA: coenzyme F420-0:L-glutamate ligase [Nocardioides sp.]|uniref:coenzyme F420-0:L-glutamate ligase n=1 Tax=Nocardioides sp. TaxID=35761 RepID=UPI002BB72673|nr:coenzyme F420-0:L-glutamate ligase [Nocardioides sp.]HQR26537.1 coenzyme F420-0:L-glutamate ligase [Nocardioides sp.]